MKNICLAIFLTLGCGMSIGLAQQVSPIDPLRQKGKLISESNSAISDGEIKVTGYRLEQIKLTVSVTRGDQVTPSEKAFRIVLLFSKPLPFHDYGVWINDRQVGAYTGKPNEAVIILDEKTLPNGTIKLGFSRVGSGRAGRLVLPGTLFVPPEYATPAAEVEAARIVIEPVCN